MGRSCGQSWQAQTRSLNGGSVSCTWYQDAWTAWVKQDLCMNQSLCLFCILVTSWGGGGSAGRSHGATRGHGGSHLCGGDEWKVQSRELSVPQRAWHGGGSGAHCRSSRLPYERWVRNDWPCWTKWFSFSSLTSVQPLQRRLVMSTSFICEQRG